MDTFYDILFTQRISERWRLVTGDAAYWAYLAFDLIAIVLVVRHVGHLPRARAQRWVRGLALGCFLGWIGPAALLVLTDTGQVWTDHLPLHVCSAACLVIPIAVWLGNQTLLNLMYGLFVPAAVAAVAMPEASYMVLSYASVHYFLFNVSHIVIIMASLSALSSGLADIRWRYYWRVLALGVGFMVVIYPVNHLLDKNFMFVNWPEPGTILELFADLAGNPGYIGVLIAFAATVIAILYVIRRAIVRLRPRRQAPA